MSTNLEEVLLRPRQCAADWLVIHARDLADLAKRTNSMTLLVFACLEARNAIEQLWCEILMVLHGGTISRKLFEKCRRRRDGFLAAIGDAECRYRQLSRFTMIAMSLDSQAPCSGVAWDLAHLKRMWHSLSEYCHAQANPAATLADLKWIAAAYALIEELFTYFQQEMSQGVTAILCPEKMTVAARMIWEGFAAGNIDEEQVTIRLRIVQP